MSQVATDEFKGILGKPDAILPADLTKYPTLNAAIKPLPDKLRVMIYRFPYGGFEHSCVTTWVPNALFTLQAHPRVEACGTHAIDMYPTYVARNKAVRHALDNGVDFMIMVDSDMFPDAYIGVPGWESVQPFLPAALDFAIQNGPCCVGVPYCTQPPEEDVLVMRWRQRESNDPDGHIKLCKFTREESIGRTGIERVGAIATGLQLIDTRPLRIMQPPWFHYEHNEDWTALTATEDVVFSHDLDLAGVPQFVFWDAWAVHWKLKPVGRPTGLPYNSCLLYTSDAADE